MTLRSDGADADSLPDRLIVCDVPDQGYLEGPQGLIQAFPEHERFGDHGSTLTRYTHARVTAEDVEVDYWVESNEGFQLEHQAE